MITAQDKSVKARHDYMPFGEEIPAGYGSRTAQQGYVVDTLRQKFTGKERDIKSGLDYFGARYFSSALGRFNSADSVFGSIGNPQTLNRYAYTLNNPLRYVDPTGHSASSTSEVGNAFNDYYDDEAEEVRHRIEKITSVQVTIQEYGGGKVVQQATITISEIEVYYVDNKGIVTGADPVRTSASAENTGGAPIKYTDDQLSMIGDIAKNIVEVSREKGFDPTIALGLAQTETHMGTLQSHEASLAKQSDVNPMQLSSSSGTKPTTNLRDNIAGAIDVYNRGAGGNLNADLQTYNNQANKAAYARTAEAHIKQIRSSKVTNWF